jgi:hypothetical protein
MKSSDYDKLLFHEQCSFVRRCVDCCMVCDMQVWCVQTFHKIINTFNYQFGFQCLDDMEDRANIRNLYPCLRNCCSWESFVQHTKHIVVFLPAGNILNV